MSNAVTPGDVRYPDPYQPVPARTEPRYANKSPLGSWFRAYSPATHEPMNPKGIS